MPKFPESDSFGRTNGREAPEHDPQFESLSITVDLTVNKSLRAERPSYFHDIEATDQQGEVDTLMHTLAAALYESNLQLEDAKTGRAPQDSEKLRQEEVAFIQRRIRNLESLIEKFRTTITPRSS